MPFRGDVENEPRKCRDRIKNARGDLSTGNIRAATNLRAREIKRWEKGKKKEAYAKENAFTRTFAYYLPRRYPSAYAGYYKPFPDGRVSTHAGEKCRSDPSSSSFVLIGRGVTQMQTECTALSRRFREMKTKVPSNASPRGWTHVSDDS